MVSFIRRTLRFFAEKNRVRESIFR
jgi:hypothetical protein